MDGIAGGGTIATMTRWLAAGVLAAGLPASATAAEPTGSALAALITDTRLAEISGMAQSRRHPGILWVHNDSDDEARLFAIDGSGKVRGALTLEGVENIDWEDMAAFEHAGRPYLLVADTGDNGGVRSTLRLLVVAEPERLQEDQHAGVAWTLSFRWPDGARDCEAVAVDAAAGFVYLVAKKRVPPEVWRIPLHPAGDAPVLAERVGTLAGVVQPSAADLEKNPVYGRYRSQITGADISADGRWFAALNYRTAYLYARNGDDDWARALARDPVELGFPWLPQAEAIAFGGDGAAVWISSEKLPAPLLRAPVP